jgi:hypothetical protein
LAIATLRAEAGSRLSVARDHLRRARSNTFVSFLPRIPLRSAFRTWWMTTGHRLHLGVLRQHFFFGLRSNSLLGFK